MGVRMGLPEDTAAVRVSRYETDVHTPDPETVQRLADLLGVSLAYRATADERMAEVIPRFSRLPTQHQDLIVKALRVMQDGDIRQEARDHHSTRQGHPTQQASLSYAIPCGSG